MTETANSTVSTSNGHQHLQRQGSSSIFDELLESGGEIGGLFQQKNKSDMQALRKIGNNTSPSSDPVCLLKEQVALYNKKSEQEFKLRISDEVSFSLQ